MDMTPTDFYIMKHYAEKREQWWWQSTRWLPRLST